MPWVKFDDGFDDSDDIDNMSCEAIALHVCATTWSARNLTDGLIPEGRIKRLPGGDSEQAIRDLTSGDKPWWIKVDGGYQIRSFLKYNPSGQEFKDRREEISRIRSEAGRKGGINSQAKQHEIKQTSKPESKSQILLEANESKGSSKKQAPNPESRIPKDPNPEIPPNPPLGALPPWLDVPEFREAWERWEAYRKQRKLRPFVQATLEAKFNAWKVHPIPILVKAIDNSIEQGYQGIFLDKAKPQPSTNGRITDEVLAEAQRLRDQGGLYASKPGST